MPPLDRLVFLAHLGSTLALVGLIWTIQVVQYPLFRDVGKDAFADYHRGHSARITRLVAPLMLLELATAVVLVAWPPPVVDQRLAWLGLGLVLAIWVSTATLQVPRHTELGAGFDATAHRRLVGSNWLRTVLWTARGVLVLWWTARWIV